MYSRRVNSECELHLDLRYVSLALFKGKKKVPIYCALSNCFPPWQCCFLVALESNFILLIDLAESANYRFSPLLSDTLRLVRYCILSGRVQYSTVQYRHLVTAVQSRTPHLLLLLLATFLR